MIVDSWGKRSHESLSEHWRKDAKIRVTSYVFFNRSATLVSWTCGCWCAFSSSSSSSSSSPSSLTASGPARSPRPSTSKRSWSTSSPASSSSSTLSTGPASSQPELRLNKKYSFVKNDFSKFLRHLYQDSLKYGTQIYRNICHMQLTLN